MSLVEQARRHPDKPAIILGETGEVVTYGELDARSLRFARLLRRRGLVEGDAVALLMESNLRYHEALFGVLRSGMYVVPINKYATAEEAAYIVRDSGARCVVVSSERPAARELPRQLEPGLLLLSVGEAVDGYEPYEPLVAAEHALPEREPEPLGDWMLYSSGTTGRPLGIRRELQHASFSDPLPIDQAGREVYDLDEDSVFLVPAPMYHSAPLCYSASALSLGATVVLMRKFDAALALELIERHRVTIGQWVPAMFVRLLKLPAEVRARFDVSSQRRAMHGAGPCSEETKRAMLDWWGPILVEYFGSTEFTGLTRCTSEEWLARPGTVGRPVLGIPHICADDGTELGPGEPGLLYFERETLPFSYHNNPERTRATLHPSHPTWSQAGDIGRLDESGYLYLLDRASFLIISGGVNIYPQEIEDALTAHPAVLDAAVFGLPDEEMGEYVKAVVELVAGREAAEGLEEELLDHARRRLAAYKVPRSVDIVARLPRQDSGKLYKRLLRDQYLEEARGGRAAGRGAPQR